jgi:hypothetical protein
MKVFLSFFVFIVFAKANAADTIIVWKDSRLETLTAQQKIVNKINDKLLPNGLYKGYRLQVLSTRSREEAFNLKAGLLQNFPEQKAYVLYQSPYFKVRFGNFLTKEEAENYKQKLLTIYSQGIYIMESPVEYNPLADSGFISN